jgi:light-regulated signal transduction histidine kinase (bacteriophytochrome)
LDTRSVTATNIKKNEAEYCGKIPLHQTNLIQPHGVLLVIDSENLIIHQVSENTFEHLGIEYGKLVNTSLEEYINDVQLQSLRIRLQHPGVGKIPLLLTFNEVEVLTMLQIEETFFIAELERIEKSTTQNSFVDIYQEIKFIMSEIDKKQNTDEAAHLIARELKKLSGFDKVMIYKFDEDWNGEVIAEDAEEGMESYLGLKFPASDIPPQARELYKKTPYRLIPNVNYAPVKLYPIINPITGTFINLTNSSLRSVASVHIEYLRNMEVSASMSTRILKDGELWGLIACHNKTPKYLSYQVCSMFEILSSIISSKFSALHNNNVFQFKSNQQIQITGIMEGIYRKRDLLDGLIDQQKDLMDLLQADGVAISMNKQIELFGKSPDQYEVKELIYWLQANNIQKLYHHPSLTNEYDNAINFSQIASGLLALPIHADKGCYILAFRQEVIQKIDWGGNPNEAVQFEKDSLQYHPRNSFQLWQETVFNKSIPWKVEELEIAEDFRNRIIEYVLINHDIN